MFRIGLLNGLVVLIKVISAFLLNKILAIYIGPAGYVVIGQFQNLISIVASLSGGLVANGVTKITAENFDNENYQKQLWQTAITSSLVASTVISILLIIFNERIINIFFEYKEINYLIYWVAASTPAIAISNVIIAISNGKKDFKSYAFANTSISIVGAIAISILAIYYGINGALIGIAISPIISILCIYFITRNKYWYSKIIFKRNVNFNILYKLLKFAIMAITSALCVPLMLVIIRTIIEKNIGINEAGYWQATWKISEIYLMLVTGSLAAYYLPRISEIRSKNELILELKKIYLFVVPMVLLSSSIIYEFRDLIIGLLFTSDFMPMRELFLWQFMGDVIKVVAWVISYLVLGKGMVRIYIISEIGFSLLFVISSQLLLDKYGVMGVTIAYAFTYMIYLFGMIFALNYILKNFNTEFQK